MEPLSTRLKNARMPAAAAVIAAAGSGTRFGGDKLLAPLGGIPVLAHTLLAFERSPAVGEIVLVARPEMTGQLETLCRRFRIGKLTAVVPGGDARAASCLRGVEAVSGRAALIAVHDGARPLVTDRIIEETLWQAYRHTAAAPAIPVRDTIKRAEDGVVVETPARGSLFAVQTPQCFERELIFAALTAAPPDVTDDCAAVERLGGRVVLTEGSEENIKITTPLDLALAELILRRRGAL